MPGNRPGPPSAGRAGRGPGLAAGPAPPAQYRPQWARARRISRSLWPAGDQPECRFRLRAESPRLPWGHPRPESRRPPAGDSVSRGHRASCP